MQTMALGSVILLGVSLACGGALAGSSPTVPIYFGDRSTNAEQETYAYLAPPAESVHPLGFAGPVRYLGTVTGDAEKDTIAYLPLMAVRENGRWSFELVER